MAIKEYLDESGSRLFQVSCSLRSGKDPSLRVQKRERGIRSMTQARSTERRLRREIQRELFERENLGLTWGKLVDSWGAALNSGTGLNGQVSRTTIDDYVQPLRLYTKEWWNRPAKEVGSADVRSILEAAHEAGKSNGRIRQLKNYIHYAFKWGIETGKIPGMEQTPAHGVNLAVRREEKKPEILTLNQIQKLLDTAALYEPRWYPIWAMALLTGMRNGELFALLWSDIDWENRRISVTKSYNKRSRTIGPTKAGYWREIPINPQLEELLKRLKAKCTEHEHVLPRNRDWEHGNQAGILRQFCAGIGIPSVKFHTLRACFATQLLRDRVAPAVVMKICGWKDLKTMQHYVRLAGIEIDGATNTLKLLSPKATMGRVVQLFGGKNA